MIKDRETRSTAKLSETVSWTTLQLSTFSYLLSLPSYQCFFREHATRITTLCVSKQTCFLLLPLFLRPSRRSFEQILFGKEREREKEHTNKTVEDFGKGEREQKVFSDWKKNVGAWDVLLIYWEAMKKRLECVGEWLFRAFRLSGFSGFKGS